MVLTMRKRRHAVGATPGTLVAPAESPPPRIHVIDYTRSEVEATEITDLDRLCEIVKRESLTWVDIQGLGDIDLLRKIGKVFGFHDLLLEDVVNVPQRPKVDEYEKHVLFVTRMLKLRDDGELDREQLSIVVGSNYVVTFQERYGDVLDPVRKRIEIGRGPIRKSGADYLAYAILDTVIDAYFPILEEIGDRLEAFEDVVMRDTSSRVLRDLNDLKAVLLILRRLVWPQREALGQVCRGKDMPLIHAKTVVYYRDTYDHCVQIAEILEQYRELAGGLVNTYLSVASNRMNETMKVLTVMASIFIPLTFIAGIYGMNFENMPELRSPMAYPVILAVMVLIAGGMLWFFRRKGWIGARTEPKD